MIHQCLKSFQIRIAQNFVVAQGNPGVSCKTWGTPGQYFWSLVFTPGGNDSLYELTGFKAVNIYGVSVNGYMRGNSSSTTKCAVVEDWNMYLIVNGNAPLISGATRVTPNGFSLISNDPDVTGYNLSKNTNTIMLADPITNVKSISFDTLYAQGIGAEFLNEVALNYGLNFTFYYKYEGED